VKESSFFFRCKKGKRQTAWVAGVKKILPSTRCASYREDTTSRGSGTWGGCPSCTHRTPDNETTRRAERSHASNEAS